MQLSPPARHKQVLLAGGLHELAVGRDQLDADQEALAPDVGHHVGEARLQPLQLLGEIAGDLAFTCSSMASGGDQFVHRRPRRRPWLAGLPP